MRRQFAAASAVAFTFGAGALVPASFAEDSPPAPGTTADSTAAEVTLEPEPEFDIGGVVLAQIHRYRNATWRWERLMRVARTPYAKVAERSNDREQRLLILKAWKKRAALRARQAHRPPRLGAWLCIHRYERHPQMGWRTATGNGFYGGLQMDLSFQRAYGPELLRRKGTANRWTALEQIWVAERAYRSGRGFYPWPHTARVCGLL